MGKGKSWSYGAEIGVKENEDGDLCGKIHWSNNISISSGLSTVYCSEVSMWVLVKQ